MTTAGREENIAAAMNNSEKVRWLYYQRFCLCVCIAMAEGQRRRWDERTCKSPKKVRWLNYLSVVVVFLLLSLCCLPHAGFGRGTTTRKMAATTTAREDNMYIAEESTLAILPVYCLLFFCCLPHAGYGGGTTMRWMVVTTEERTTSPKNVCWLYYLHVSGVFVVVISLVSHMLAMAEG